MIWILPKLPLLLLQVSQEITPGFLQGFQDLVLCFKNLYLEGMLV